MFFSVVTKNSNWEILSKNLVTIKKQDGVKDEKIYYFLGLKSLIFRSEGYKKQFLGGGEGCEKVIQRGDCLKRTVCLDSLQKEGVGIFEGGLIPQCTLCKQKGRKGNAKIRPN